MGHCENFRSLLPAHVLNHDESEQHTVGSRRKKSMMRGIKLHFFSFGGEEKKAMLIQVVVVQETHLLRLWD